MLLSRKELLQMAEKYQKTADKAMRSYQDTGDHRYYTQNTRNEDLADALRAAAYAAETAKELGRIKADLITLAQKADDAANTFNMGKLREVAQDLVDVASLYGYRPNRIDRKSKDGIGGAE